MNKETILERCQREAEELFVAEQLHEWYLEATKSLNPENYNAKAQVPYSEMNEEQKEIDRYIARKILEKLQSQAEEYEREKGEMVREIMALKDEQLANAEGEMDVDTRYLKMRASLRNALLDEIQTIAQKYGVDLSEK